MTFAERVYEIVKRIPKGKVATYKCVAECLNVKAYRAVGQALKNNPFAPVVPCHRVVSSSGRVGGFMGKGSGKTITRKIKLLEAEGVMIVNGLVDNKYFIDLK